MFKIILTQDKEINNISSLMKTTKFYMNFWDRHEERKLLYLDIPMLLDAYRIN